MSEIIRLQKVINQFIENDLKENTNFNLAKIKASSELALNGGKRLRPIIVLAISQEKEGEQSVNIERAVLAIEYIHNASLIIDDLPIMDDDLVRRGQPTVHAHFGVRLANLTSYNLIVVAMSHVNQYLAQFRHSLQSDIASIIMNEVTDMMGVQGLCGGQYLDLFLKDELKDLDQNTKRQRMIDMIHRKTSCLFELSFILGWVARCDSSSDPDQLTAVKEVAKAFGLAFQIADDLEDLEQDLVKGNDNNICQYYSPTELKSLFERSMEDFEQGLETFGLSQSSVFKELTDYLSNKFSRYYIEDIDQ